MSTLEERARLTLEAAKRAAEALACAPLLDSPNVHNAGLPVESVHALAHAAGVAVEATVYLPTGEPPYVIEVAEVVHAGVRMRWAGTRPATKADAGCRGHVWTENSKSVGSEVVAQALAGVAT